MKRLMLVLVILLISILVITACSTNLPPAAAPSTTASASNPPTTTTSIPSAPATQPKTLTTPTNSKPVATTSTTSAPAAGSQKYGGLIRWIESSSPAVIGVPSLPGGVGWSSSFAVETELSPKRGGVLGPNLTESFEVNSDPNNPSITFHLRKGVKFSDGTDFNAQAAKWNFDQLKAAPNWVSTTTYWKSIEVIDNYTLRINFTMWQNRILAGFSYNGIGSVISPTAFQKNGVDWMRRNLVGTGPFVQTDFQQDVRLNLARNPNYWDSGKPYLDNIQILYVADEMTQIALFKSGGADVLNCVFNAREANTAQTAGYNIISMLAGAVQLIPDSADPDSPWSNVKVRQAAEYALDKEAIAKTFGYGFWPAAYQVFSPSSLAYDSTIAGRKYDSAKARQLLTDAGYPNGFKTRIVVQTGGNSDIPAAVQSYLAKIGIQTDIETVEAAKFINYGQTGWKNALLLSNSTSYTEYPNPVTGWNLYYGIPSANNVSLKRPDGWKDLMTAALSTPAADAVPNKALENAAYNDAMVIPLYYATNMWATTNQVRDTALGTGGLTTYFEPQNMWLSK